MSNLTSNSTVTKTRRGKRHAAKLPKPTPINRPDIHVNNPGGFGFFSILGATRRGIQWLKENVEGVNADGVAYCDDMRMASDIADGAVAAGLRVV